MTATVVDKLFIRGCLNLICTVLPIVLGRGQHNFGAYAVCIAVPLICLYTLSWNKKLLLRVHRVNSTIKSEGGF